MDKEAGPGLLTLNDPHSLLQAVKWEKGYSVGSLLPRGSTPLVAVYEREESEHNHSSECLYLPQETRLQKKKSYVTDSFDSHCPGQSLVTFSQDLGLRLPRFLLSLD